MKQINLTPEELSLLRDYYKTSPVVLIRNKALSIIMKNEGFSTLQIKSCLDRSVYTINGWIRNFHKIRMGSIFSGHVDNENASKLTKEQKNKIKNDLVLPPSEYGIPKEFWNVPSLRSYIKAEFGVTYESNQSYHYLLKFCEFSFKYPDTFSINRDETAIKARMKEIRKEIKQYLKNPEWEVFAADEVRMVLEAITRRAWLRKGKRTILKVNQTNEYQSYFGALNQKTFQCHTFELSWQNQEEIIPAVKKLIDLYPNKKICIVWDNAKFHKGLLIREALKKGNLLERVHLINFPPYAPDYNPIEHVWNTIKTKLANSQFDSFEITKAMFLEEVNRKKYRYKI